MDTLRAYLRPLADILTEVFGLSSGAADGAALAVAAVVLATLTAAVTWLFRKARHLGSEPTETLPAQKQLPADPHPDQAEPDLFLTETDRSPPPVQDSRPDPGTHTDGAAQRLAAEPERGPGETELGSGPAGGNGTEEIESLFNTGPDLPDFSDPSPRWGRRKRRGAPHDDRGMGDAWAELGLEDGEHEAGPAPAAAPVGEASGERELGEGGSRGTDDVGPPRLNTLASLEMLVGAVAIWADQERTRLSADGGDMFDELVAAERQRIRASRLDQQLRALEQEQDAAAAQQERVEQELAALDTSAPSTQQGDADPASEGDAFTAFAAALDDLPTGGPAGAPDLELERRRLLAERQQAQEAVVAAERRRETLLADGEARPWAPEGPGESEGDGEAGRVSAAAAIEEFGRTVALVAAAVRAMLDQMASAQSVEELAAVSRPAFVAVREGVTACAERADAAVGAAGSGAVAQARVAVSTAVSRFAADWDALEEAVTAAVAAADLHRERERVVAAADTVSAAAAELPTPEQLDAVRSQVAELVATRDALTEQVTAISEGLAAVERTVDAHGSEEVALSLGDTEAELGQLAGDLLELERSLQGLAVAATGVVRLLVEQNLSVTAASRAAAAGRSAGHRAGLVVNASRQLEEQLTVQYGPAAHDGAADDDGFDELSGSRKPSEDSPDVTDGEGAAVEAGRPDGTVAETFDLTAADDRPDGGGDDQPFPPSPPTPSPGSSAPSGEEGEGYLDADAGRYGEFLAGEDQHLHASSAASPGSSQPDTDRYGDFVEAGGDSDSVAQAGYSDFVAPDGGVDGQDGHDAQPEPFGPDHPDEPELHHTDSYSPGVDAGPGVDDGGLLPPDTAQIGAAPEPDDPAADSDPSPHSADQPFAADTWQQPPQPAAEGPGQSDFNGLAPQNFTAASVPPELGGNRGGKRGRRNRRR